MSIQNLFPFIPPREQRKREEALKNRIFPGGASQRKEILSLLRQLTEPSKNWKDETLLYMFITVKDTWLSAEAEEEDRDKALRHWFNSSLCPQFTKKERFHILALAIADMERPSCEQPIFLSRVKETAENLMANDCYSQKKKSPGLFQRS